jgi:hypothetical protein
LNSWATKKSVGMDECDTAAVKFDCAKNKEPELVNRMIINSELNLTAVTNQTDKMCTITIYYKCIGGQSYTKRTRDLHVNKRLQLRC